MKKSILRLEAPWPQVKELLMEANSNLNEDDLQYDPENEEGLLERLAKKMGRDKAHIKGWIESVASNKRPAS